MSYRKKVLGILGGLGPLAGVYFYRLITEHTKALCDRDHLDVIVVSGASTPDRTDFIMGKSPLSPLPKMKEDVGRLAAAGAEIIAVPCNTAHFFFDELDAFSPVPVLNIVRETAEHAKAKGVKRVGILATDGTIFSGSYKHECDRLGMEYVTPGEPAQKELMEIIYKSIKASAAPDMRKFNKIADELASKGCDAIILGCTELSLLPKDQMTERNIIIDSLFVLATNAISLCGAEPTGFDGIYDT